MQKTVSIARMLTTLIDDVGYFDQWLVNLTMRCQPITDYSLPIRLAQLLLNTNNR